MRLLDFLQALQAFLRCCECPRRQFFVFEVKLTQQLFVVMFFTTLCDQLYKLLCNLSALDVNAIEARQVSRQLLLHFLQSSFFLQYVLLVAFQVLFVVGIAFLLEYVLMSEKRFDD